MRRGPHPAEQRRAEDQPRQQLPDDGGLTEALHQFAEPAPDQQQQHNLRQKNDFTRAADTDTATGFLFGCGQGRARNQARRRAKQGWKISSIHANRPKLPDMADRERLRAAQSSRKVGASRS